MTETVDGRDGGEMRRGLTVSVVMATYNGAQHLDEQLASLVAQTRLPDELVVGDDGSTDATLSLLERFARTAPFPVRIHRQPTNLGPDQNFGDVLALATGDVLLCCDQDDRWRPHKIARLADVLEREPQVGLVMSDAALVDEAMRPTGDTIWGRFDFVPALRARVERGDAFTVLARRMPVYGCTTAVRREYAPIFLPVPQGATYDSWIGQVVSVLAPIRLIAEPLLDYRQHAAQFTGFEGGSRLRRLRSMVARSDAGAVRAEVVRLEAMEQRLLAFPRTARRDRALTVTRDRLRLTRRRLAARRARLRRFPLVILGVIRGEYARGAQGFRSAAVDLLAPRER